MTRLRAAAHVHSDWSYDGSWSLQNLARAFGKRGYDLVLMAEHDRGFTEERWRAYGEACQRVSTDRVLVVPGIEYSDRANGVHVPAWGDLPFVGEGIATQDLLREIADRRGTAILAHPARREAWRRVTPEWLHLLQGVELWNVKYDGWSPSKPAARLLASERRLIPFVGPDFHTSRQFFPVAMVVEADGLTRRAVYEALAAGYCQPTVFRLPSRLLAREPLFSAMRGVEHVRARGAAAVKLRTRLGALRRSGGEGANDADP